MDDKLLIKKIQALLHDPPEKPIILGRIGHEGRAKELMAELGLLNEATIPSDVRTADHIASAADRINLPRHAHFIADFCGKPVIKHPLSAKEFDLKALLGFLWVHIQFSTEEQYSGSVVLEIPEASCRGLHLLNLAVDSLSYRVRNAMPQIGHYVVQMPLQLLGNCHYRLQP